MMTLAWLVQVSFLLLFPRTPRQLAGALADAQAVKPPMGYNTWNAFHCDISEELIYQQVDRMVELGLRDAGYTYFNLDDCWMAMERDSEGRLQANERFPSGMKAIGDYIHSKGLQFGIYSSSGVRTCEGYPGSRGYEREDAASFAEWGVDYLKYDNCFLRDDEARVQDRFLAMGRALEEVERPMVYSICEWGVAAPWEWAGAVGHLWRTTNDIQPTWESMLEVLDKNIGLARFGGPGRWNDPDMLEVGHASMTDWEQRAHFAIWAVLKAPLLIGADLRTLTPHALKTLTAVEVVAVGQDGLGVPGDLVYKEGSREVYAAPLEDGGRAVVLLQRGDHTPLTVNVTWTTLGYPADTKAVVRDLYERRDLGTFSGSYQQELGRRSCAALRVTPVHPKDTHKGWRPWHACVYQKDASCPAVAAWEGGASARGRLPELLKGARLDAPKEEPRDVDVSKLLNKPRTGLDRFT